MLIYITGDMHGDIKRFDKAAIRRLKATDSLIICGDFGFIWNGDEAEEKILKKLSKKKFNILFLDGAHENFDLLDKYPVEQWCGGHVHKIADNIFHLMRGEVFKIEGKRFFVFGGGDSPEKAFRIEAGKWWSKESPSFEEMQHGVDCLKENAFSVDYIITHTPCPGIAKYEHQRATVLELYFERVEKAVRHRKWFFGCLHINRHFTARCEGVFDNVIPIS